MRKIIASMLFLLLAYPAFSSWPQFQKDCKHTAEVCDITINSPLCIKYRYPMPSMPKQGGQPLTDDKGFVYINSAGKISKFDPKTGNFVWIKSGYDTTNAPGIIYKNTIIYSYLNLFRAHDLDTGNVVWQKTVTGMNGSYTTNYPGNFINSCFPTLSDGKIYSGNNAGQLVIINADTGDTINVWPVSTDPLASNRELLPSPAVDDDGTVYIGARDNYLYAVNSLTGAIKWKINLAGQVVGSASLDSTGVYIINGSPAYVYKLNKTNGSIIWSKLIGSFANGTGALYGDSYYFGSDDRSIYRVDKDTGMVKWKIYVEDNMAKMSCIIICAKLFVLGCIDKMIMMDTATGNKEYVCHTTASNFTNIGYSNGELFFTSNDGYVYVVGECPKNCVPCSCDAHKLTPTLTYTTGPLTATFTPTVTVTATRTVTRTITPTFTSTLTPPPVDTDTPVPVDTDTPVPVDTDTPVPPPAATATPDPCLNAAAPQFTVKMIFNPEATDDIIFEITSTVELVSPPSAVICPHGVKNLSAGSMTKLCTKSCQPFTSEPIPGESKKYRILFPKTTGFGDIDSVTVKGTSKCGVAGTSVGSFDKSVISDQDVQIFKNVIKPDQGERCIIHYKVYGNDKITVKIYDRNGQIVRTLLDKAVKMTGEYDVIWDGTENGKIVASGIYTAVVESVYYKATEKISVLR
jgi:outer membrane protein assembly factor BamB